MSYIILRGLSTLVKARAVLYYTLPPLKFATLCSLHSLFMVTTYTSERQERCNS